MWRLVHKKLVTKTRNLKKAGAYNATACVYCYAE